MSKNDLGILLKKEDINPDFIQRTFKDIFYSKDELQFLDLVSHNIKKIKNPHKQAIAMPAQLDPV